MRTRAAALLLVALLALGWAVGEPPTGHGDSAEYLLMAESLFNHGTPELQAQDVASFTATVQRHGLAGDVGRPLSQYATAPGGRQYAVHFWAYPALVLPAKLALRIAGANELKAFQLTNVLAALALLAHVLLFSGLRRAERLLLALLLVTSPALPFLLWPHPELVTAALVASSLLFRRDGHRVAGVLAMALASLQAAPLALAAAVLWAEASWAARRDASPGPALVRLSLAITPAFLPALFALAKFHHASPLALVGAYEARRLSLGRALELLFDLNLGLLPYVPLTVTLALASPLARLGGRASERPTSPGLAGLLGAVALAALASTGVANWNHGTVGPSRYGIWLLGPLSLLVVEGVEAAGARLRRIAWPLAVLAVLAQGAIVTARGGARAPEDYLKHSSAARFVLDRAPALYNPTPEIFVERSLGREINPDLPFMEPVVYRSADGCRKAWVQKRHLEAVVGSCGRPPARSPDFRQLKARLGVDAGAYVSW
jgi:hypothetical protein